ncbi:MAG TPA: hypothetical protein DEA08_24245 [Planctomycetes bacterium]|nr:hypothetical protein [Planctomycetota bacterium]
MEGFVRFILRRRVPILALCALLTLAGVASLSRAVLASSLGELFLGEDPGFARYQVLSERFSSDEILALGISDPELFEPPGTQRLEATVADLRSLSSVRRVYSLLDAAYLEPGPLLPQPRRYLEQALAEPGQADALRERLRADPLVGGLLISRDGQSAAILVELDPAATESAEGIPDLVAEILARVGKRYRAGQVHAAGMPAMVAEVFRQTFWALAVTTPLVGLVLLLSVWALFGRLWPAAVSLGVAAVAVIWTLGVAVAIDPHLNVMMGAVPAVILIISFSDIVHLCSAYLMELGVEGHDKEAAILASATEVGRACLFTSITTFVGFFCLSFLPVPVFRVLGVVLGLGVGVALLLAVTLVPILFSLLPEPAPLRQSGARRGLTERLQGLLDGALARCERLAVGKPWLVIGGFFLVTLLSIWGASRLRIETDFKARLRPSNPVRQDQEWFLRNFLAADALHVYVKAPSPDQLEDPAWLARVAAFQRAVLQVEGVRGASSVIDALVVLHRATRPLPPPDAGFPEDPRRVSGLLRLAKLAKDDQLRGVLDQEEGRLRVVVYPAGTGMRTNAEIGREIEALAKQHLSGDEVETTGLMVLFGDFLDVVVAAQQDGLLISCVTIALLMMFGLGSLRVGLVSMLPNLMPLAVLGACLGLFWDAVDSDTIALSYIALGIGVDDTIHFLVRYRLESRRPGPASEAIGRTFSFAGRGIVMTTLILSCGFLPFLISDYFFMRMLGTLLPLCFVVALLADILWIPAMAQVGWLSFPSAEEGTAGNLAANAEEAHG